jgi:RNA polymerase sigma-70 factor (ECF subfamily)
METEDAPKQDPTADFQDCYRRELSYVVHTLRRLGVKPAELEDVAHDVFVAVYRHFGERDPARPLKPWLFGFCFRIASDHRKLAWHRHEAPAGDHDTADPARWPDELVAEERLRRQLLAALDAMDFEKRSLVVMHDLEGIGVPEIAALLAVPLNTAYSRLRLARADFEKQLVKITGGSHE